MRLRHGNLGLDDVRGGWVYPDCDFVVCACKQCGQQYLYDEEIDYIYWDPEDLQIRFAPYEPCPPCSRCGEDLYIIYLEADSPEVVEGPWSWTRTETDPPPSWLHE